MKSRMALFATVSAFCAAACMLLGLCSVIVMPLAWILWAIGMGSWVLFMFIARRF